MSRKFSFVFAILLSISLVFAADTEAPTLARTPYTVFPYMSPGSAGPNWTIVSGNVNVSWNQTDYLTSDGVPYPNGTGIKAIGWYYRTWYIPEGSSTWSNPSSYANIFYQTYNNSAQGEGMRSFVFPASSLPDGMYDFDVWMEDFAGNGWWSGWGGDWIFYALKVPDKTAPNVSVSGAPASWSNSSANVSVACNDNVSLLPSGCNASTYKLATFASNPGSCPMSPSNYTLNSPQTVSTHVWVCAMAKDKKGNIGYSQPAKEIRVDTVLPYGYATKYPYNPIAYQNVSYTAFAYDTLSGINKIDLVLDGATVKTCTYSNSCTYNASAGANGTYHYYYGSYSDNVGNWNWTGLYSYYTG